MIVIVILLNGLLYIHSMYLSQYCLTAYSLETMFHTILRTSLTFTVQTVQAATYTILKYLH